MHSDGVPKEYNFILSRHLGFFDFRYIEIPVAFICLVLLNY